MPRSVPAVSMCSAAIHGTAMPAMVGPAVAPVQVAISTLTWPLGKLAVSPAIAAARLPKSLR